MTMASSSRPRTPSYDIYEPDQPTNNPPPAAHSMRNNPLFPGSRPNSYINSSIAPTEFHVRTSFDGASPVAGQQSRFHEELSMSGRGSSLAERHPTYGNIRGDAQRTQSQTDLPSRMGTLKKKKAALSKKGSLRRGGSKRSSRAGSVRSMRLGEKEKYGVSEDELNSAFYVPIPTKGNPTEVLATRFQAWRDMLKGLISVFRDIQRSYETRSKVLLTATNVMSNISMPPTFLLSGGIWDATNIIKSYHQQALLEANKAKEVEAEIIGQLTSLRGDLQNKIKEIKGLTVDFKNGVDKEMEATRKAVRHLHEALGLVDSDPAATSGKGDPFIIKLGVDKQLERQIHEENYLHQAHLNLESSGRELESIVVGEIQKAYSAYASIIKRDADTAYDAVERLRDGPVSMPKDHEWHAFVSQSDHLIDPELPLREVENITYPGQDHPAAAEVRAGMLERKSKYLKNYTPGWYVLSATHLHEFKSADRISSQNPVMSLYLPEQKLGTHSQPNSSSHKFILKGRQTGAMHRGHAWVFRAESEETMLAWYEDIKSLTEKTGEARNTFVRKHARNNSGATHGASSISSDGAMEEDEADRTPYSADQVLTKRALSPVDSQSERPQPGGRFPSEVQLERHLQTALNSPFAHGQTDEHAGGYGGDGAHDTNYFHSSAPPSDPDMRGNQGYREWIPPEEAPSRTSAFTPNPRRTRTPSPQSTHTANRVRSVASSTGVPGLVTGDPKLQTGETLTLSTQPTNTDTKSLNTVTAATSIAGTTEAGANEQGYDDPGDSGIPERNKISRMSTSSDFKVPGQFPRVK